MTIQQAVEKAIEGGYKVDPKKVAGVYNSKTYEFMGFDGLGFVFLDHLFWQSLGKALGWYAGEWKQRAMSFFDETVCEGKDVESFFANL